MRAGLVDRLDEMWESNRTFSAYADVLPLDQSRPSFTHTIRQTSYGTFRKDATPEAFSLVMIVLVSDRVLWQFS
jgi:hypothetical protein